MQKLYIVSRLIHRITVIVILTFTVLMGSTGLLIKYIWLSSLMNIDIGMMRFVHNSLSAWFVIVLLVMAITGSIMYIYPWYIRRKHIN